MKTTRKHNSMYAEDREGTSCWNKENKRTSVIEIYWENVIDSIMMIAPMGI